MSSAYRRAPAREDGAARRRALSFLVALGIEVLIVLAFVRLRPTRPTVPVNVTTLSTFDVASEVVAAPEPAKRSAAQRTLETAVRPVPVPPPRKPSPDVPLDLLIVSKEVLAASDISKLGSNAPGSGQTPGRSPGDSERVGTGPNGEALYAAEWVREPTSQELAYYLPKRMPEAGGSGLIACRTAPRSRVEDCVELGSSPPGSRLASAVRQAAWQFLVRPPRVGGRPQVGEWVRIRIDYSSAPPN